MSDPSNLRKRRGAAKASITKLASRLKQLESKVHEPSTLELAQQLVPNLNSLDARFKEQHFLIIDLLEEGDETSLAKEQEVLDNHDEELSTLLLRTQQLIRMCSSASDTGSHKIISRNLTDLKARMEAMRAAFTTLSKKPEETHLYHHYQEQLQDFKSELGAIRQNVLSMSTSDAADLTRMISGLDKEIFDISIRIKEFLYPHKPPLAPTEATPTTSHGVRLPKLDVPTFDGDILNWSTFWEQFCIAVHDRTHLSDTEKLAYLRHSLKDGAAKSSVEGLSRSGDQYAEAIECLRARYNRPKLIHQAHVKRIVDIPSLKDGSGKELRRLHDMARQHIRALKTLGNEPDGPFITSFLQLKLDPTTLFEWQKHDQDSATVSGYDKFLEFVNLRAQASECLLPERSSRPNRSDTPRRNFQPRSATFTAGVGNACVVCKADKHPLFACSQFKSMTRDKMMSTIRNNELCMNCLKPGHFAKHCPSSNRCRKCERSHHTLIHNDSKESHGATALTGSTAPLQMPPINSLPGHNLQEVSSNASTGSNVPNTLLMTCQVQVVAPDGTSIKARALLDSGSTMSFVSERIVQSLGLNRQSQRLTVSGIGGMSSKSPLSFVSMLEVSSLYVPKTKYAITAVVVPRVTCDLPLQPVYNSSNWSHISNLSLADPDFGTPGRIDLLLGADIYADVLLHGRRCGPPGTPTALETRFGWVLTGRTQAHSHSASHPSVASHHTTVTSGDDILRTFWEIEENPKDCVNLSPEERTVIRHFKENHSRSKTGRFIVPLPKNPQCKPMGESRSQAVRRFHSLERSLYAKGQFQEFATVMNEYFELKHAEPVPLIDLQKPTSETFYLPMHAVRKEHSTTTKVRVVFDASAKSSSGVSLNDTLLVGPTIHPPLIDVLLRFRFHRIALTADVSKMYRAIELVPSDRDLHRFIWRNNVKDPLINYRMTRVTFGVSASSFAANMAVKQNAIDFATEFPRAARVVDTSFYVDDCLTGADSIAETIDLHAQLHTLFSKGGFLLRKWNSSDSEVIKQIPSDLREIQPVQALPSTDQYTKTLGVEWNSKTDHFRLTIANLPPLKNITKRELVSDVAKTFDVLGWFAPTTIKVKILLQRLWEQRVDWDDLVPDPIYEEWFKWRSELNLLPTKLIPRCYFDKNTQVASLELHGFSDASENAYAAVVYLRITDTFGRTQISLVSSKTKVAPIKKLTIPRLELCGAYLLAQLLFHIQSVFNMPLSSVYAWTDSTIVLSWLIGNPRRFKTYVGNRVSYIVELISPERWNHVEGIDNPADCASRGMYPSELLDHKLWWDGPSWLHHNSSHWPKRFTLPLPTSKDEERELSLHAVSNVSSCLLNINDYSSFARLKRIASWTLRFTQNCRSRKLGVEPNRLVYLTTKELYLAELYLCSIVQRDHFTHEIEAIKTKAHLDRSSTLLSLRPLMDSAGLLRVGGRQQHSQMPYSKKHPIILHHKHPLTHLIIRSEHIRLLHAGPTLLMASLNNRYHILGCRKIIRSITRGCVTCRKLTIRPSPQMIGQLPIERLTPGPVFDKIGIDFAGPIQVKYAHVRKPVIVKAYVCLFVSLSVKAVHLEPVSDLTTDAFIAALRRFTARRGKPSLILSDHGTNFTGATRELKEIYEFFNKQKTQGDISEFCSAQCIEWRFIPERAPHFGGLWEAAVKSMKFHFKRIVSNTKLTFEELTTILTQIESCLNSRPLAPLPHEEDNIEALTPGHFLTGRPLESIPDPSFSYRNLSLLKRWYLCQSVVRHFWKRWSDEYLSSLRRHNKWKFPSRNLQVGDIVVLQEDNLITTKWPLAKVIQVYPGTDGLVRVATVKTSTGVYRRPVAKLALLLPQD